MIRYNITEFRSRDGPAVGAGTCRPAGAGAARAESAGQPAPRIGSLVACWFVAVHAVLLVALLLLGWQRAVAERAGAGAGRHGPGSSSAGGGACAGAAVACPSPAPVSHRRHPRPPLQPHRRRLNRVAAARAGAATPSRRHHQRCRRSRLRSRRHRRRSQRRSRPQPRRYPRRRSFHCHHRRRRPPPLPRGAHRRLGRHGAASGNPTRACRSSAPAQAPAGADRPTSSVPRASDSAAAPICSGLAERALGLAGGAQDLSRGGAAARRRRPRHRAFHGGTRWSGRCGSLVSGTGSAILDDAVERMLRGAGCPPSRRGWTRPRSP